jgi:hypothetical protein
MGQQSVKDFLGKKYKEMDFTGEWEASFGRPESNFRCLIYGEPKNGKTEFCIKLTKYLSNFTKVYYYSFEQKFSKSLQDALKRNKMEEVRGKVLFSDGETLEQIKERFRKKNSPGACIIDSRDYMGLTDKQFQELIEQCPNKIFIVICWERGGKPKGEHAKNMLFMIDVSIRVKNFKAEVRSRFGGNEPFVIWDKKVAKQEPVVTQISLFNGTKSA